MKSSLSVMETNIGQHIEYQKNTVCYDFGSKIENDAFNYKQIAIKSIPHNVQTSAQER